MVITLIFGLGNNIGGRTPHDVGFNFLEYLGIEFTNDHNRDCVISEVEFGGDKMVFAKPLHININYSGKVVKKLKDRYKVNSNNIVVIYDDIDIPPGQYRIGKWSGGSHNGIRSIKNEIDSTDFTRVRIGVGRDHNVGEVIDNDTFILIERTFPHIWEEI